MKIANIIINIQILKSSVCGIIFIPNEAGNTYEIYCRNEGNILEGNIAPDSITDGKKTACPNMVISDAFFANTPINNPTPSLAKIKLIKDTINKNKLSGKLALYINFPNTIIIILRIRKWINDEITLLSIGT